MLNKINAKIIDMRLKKNRDKKKVKYNRLGLKMLIVYLGSILFLIMLSMPSILGDAGLPSVSISQIYLNTTDLNLSSADPNFSVPVPPNYSIAESLFSFENVSMEPYTMGFETDTSHIDGFCYTPYWGTNYSTAVLAIPFQVPMDCKVSQISFYVRNEDPSNTKWVGYYISASKLENNSLQIDRTTGWEWGDSMPKLFEGWYSLNGSYTLNNSNTYNNIWFLAITIDYYPLPGAVAYRIDNSQGDNNDQFDVYNCSHDDAGHLAAISDLRVENGSTIDLFAKIKLRSALDNSTVKPNYIHLKLNNTQIDDDGNISVNEGLKVNNNTNLNYKLTSSWYNFSCILANRYIKFTKDINALSIPINELGVTMGYKLGFTISDSDFGSQFINHSVQIAVPNIWEITSVKRGGAGTSYNIEEYSDRKIVNIEGATPGYWELIASDPTNKTKAVLMKVGVYGGIIGGIAVISAIAIIKYKAKEEKDLLRYYGTD